MNFWNRDVILLSLSLYRVQIFAKTEADTQVLAYSEGAVVPCTVSADMNLSQTTGELVKVSHTVTSDRKKPLFLRNPSILRPVIITSSIAFTFLLHFHNVLQIPGGSTDCSLPVTWATENGKAVDLFIILTNNPLWAFTASPVESLQKHRQVR